MGFFQRLQAETAAERQALTELAFIQAGVAGKLSLDEYIAFLSQAYHHVKHTVPLLMACGASLPESHEWLREAVAEYIEEELGHQEWILNDIAACGADKEAVRNSRPGAAAELMVSYAYDTIQRGNPVGFFGMVQVLEGTSIAVADAAANAIQTKLGLPNRAFSYLKSHGALDIEHVQFFEKLMDKVEDEADQEEIIHRAKMFYRLYGDIFRSLDAGQPLHKKVA
jgi:thiaminase